MADCLANLNSPISLAAQASHISQQRQDHRQDNDRQEHDVPRADPETRIYTNRRLSQKICCWRTM
jgi:hypothetical protein